MVRQAHHERSLKANHERQKIREAQPSCPPLAEVPRFIGAEVDGGGSQLVVKLSKSLKYAGQFFDACGGVFYEVDAKDGTAFFHERPPVRLCLRRLQLPEGHNR